MNEKKLRNKNLALRIFIFIATYTGIQAVQGFFNIKISIKTADDYDILAMSAALALDYLGFLIFSLAAFVMNFIARAAVSKRDWIIRSVVMGIALILIWYSAPSISYITYMGASRYSEISLAYPIDMDFVTAYISGNLWTVFSYMVSAAAYVVLTITSIVSIANFRKKRQEML